MIRPIRVAMACSFLFVAMPAFTSACKIPVFRYALERWESDRFQVIVFHDGPLAPADAAAIEKLDRQSVVAGGPLNIEVIRDDIRTAEPPKLLMAERPPPGQPLPLVEIRARSGNSGDGTSQWSRLWRGPLQTAITEPGLFDSPARSELVRRILEGHSAVWLLVTTDVETSKRQATALQELLDAAAQSISLPEGIGLPGSELHASVPLEIRFSVLAISHQDAAEAGFLKLVSANTATGNKPDAYVIPVFGRCRALDVIPYSTLDGAMVEEISAFISGACSCQVKQANPGFDLLVSANWDEKLFGLPSTGEGRVSPNNAVGSEDRSSPAGEDSEAEYVAIPVGEGSASQTAEPGVSNHPTRSTVASELESGLGRRGTSGVWGSTILWSVIVVCGLAIVVGTLTAQYILGSKI